MQTSEDKKDDGKTHNGENPGDKGYKIIINGVLKTIEKEEISFEELVALAFSDGLPETQYTRYVVTYKDAVGRKTEGNLAKGEVVKVKKEGTQFDVERTDKS